MHVHAWAVNGSQTRTQCRWPPQAPSSYAGDPGRSWGLLGAKSRGVGSGGLGTSQNGALAMTRSSPERALRQRNRDFSQPRNPEGRKCHGRSSRVHGNRSQRLGPAKVTDISVRAARGGARPMDAQDLRSMASVACRRTLACVLEH
jgi:hypothetical protein